MKKLLFYLCVLLVTAGCQQASKPETKEEKLIALQEKVLKNEHFLAVPKLSREMAETGYIDNKEARDSMVNKLKTEMADVKSPEDFKKKLTEIGMPNADKVLALNQKIKEHMEQLFNDIPELKTLSQEDLKFVLNKDSVILKAIKM